MFYDNDKVNLLIGLLKAYGISDVVLCPGSRNAMIVNNIISDGGFKCYPVTDERSAAFFALGVSYEKGPVAIVVTSGSAVLDVAPAVVEAYYQHRPLVVISADRPQEDIGQNVGQTMRQAGALDNYVRKSVTLTDALGDNMTYHRRLICEALSAATYGEGGPVHINVPLPNATECPQVSNIDIPAGRKVEIIRPTAIPEAVIEELLGKLLDSSRKPLIVIGQTPQPLSTDNMTTLRHAVPVVSEPLSSCSFEPFDGFISTMPDEYLPDFVLYMGGSLVCRSINGRLSSVESLELWRVNADGDFSCPFRHIDKVLACDANELVDKLADKLRQRETPKPSKYKTWWEMAFKEEKRRIMEGVDEYSLTAESTVAYFENQLSDMDYPFHLHYANSTAIRLACRHGEDRYVYCNRGVNGIDGCVSTAVGHAAATDFMVFCVTGDLSFFYDQNALWNQNLGDNLRIIILNDHHGGIFDHVRGLENCDSRYVAGCHNTDARGITTQNDVGYLSAKTIDEMHLGIVRLMTEKTSRPMVLEVFV